jgi:hypothetical protein
LHVEPIHPAISGKLKLIGDRVHKLRRLSEEARVNAALVQLILAVCTKVDLSEAEFAECIGTKQAVISRFRTPNCCWTLVNAED